MELLHWVALWYAAWSVVTFFVTGWDKLAARHGWRRVPESTLHLLEFVGGWPGGLVAQELFRHKRSKRAYRAWFWAIVAVHAAGWGIWGWQTLRG